MMVYLQRVKNYLVQRLDGGIILTALLALFIIQSLLKPGLPTLADLPIHLYRTYEYGLAWTPEALIPRWSPNLAYGYGYPLYIFAPPLPYWLGLSFYALSIPFESAFKLLIIVTILLYAIGMYLLIRDVLGSVQAGLIAATAYAFAPFALREALLAGGNVPQYLAIALFPWTLWAVARSVSSGSWAWTVISALFFAGVLLSHLFQALVFTPVVGLFGLLLCLNFAPLEMHLLNNLRNRKTIGRLDDWKVGYFPTFQPSNLPGFHSFLQFWAHPLATIPLGLLLAAFFWLPAFIERDFTRAQAEIYLVKSPFFVRYPYWDELTAWIQPLDARAANPYTPLTLGVITLALAVLGLTLIFKPFLAGVQTEFGHPNVWQNSVLPQVKRVFKESSASSVTSSCSLCSTFHYLWPGSHSYILLLFFALVAAGAAFMSLPASRLVWETISILQVAEFPWRMLGLANLGLAFLAGAAILWLPGHWRWPVTTVCLLVQLWSVAPYLYPVIPFTQYSQVNLATQADYERRSQSIGTTTLGEYLPPSVTRPPTTSPLIDSFLKNQNPPRLDQASLPAGATATLQKQSAVTHRYQIETTTPFTARFFQFDFPGWRATLDDQPTSLRPEAETGLILVDVSAGKHTLSLHFGDTPTRILANALTGLTIVALLAGGLWQRATRPGDNMDGASPALAARLPLRSPWVWLSFLAILVSALWLQPALQPLFTLDSPPGQAHPAQVQTRIEFANGIQLIGYDLPKKVVPAGERLAVTLYWQTTAAPLPLNLQPFVHLDRFDTFTTVAGATNYTPGDVTTETVLPTFHWDNGRYVRDEHDLIIPPETPALAYALRVGLIDPDRQDRLLALADGSGDTAFLTYLNIAPTRPAVSLAQPINAYFNAGPARLQLIGFEVEPLTSNQLNFKLAWQTDQTPPTNYTVFAQLLDSANNLVAGFDQPPLAGAYPTATWLPRQTIIDPRFIPVDQVPPGEYRLVVGWYDPASQQRLPSSSGAGFVELTRLTINRAN